MNKKRVARVLFISSVAVILMFMLGIRQAELSSLEGLFPLIVPPFIVSAQGTTSSIGAKLDAEAGISAWYKAPGGINLGQVRSAFRTIETENAQYIIGSVDVPEYAEHFDAHVYVHKDGWILAYYGKEAPVSKLVDVKASTIDTTILETVVSLVASAGGAPFGDVTYYDFRCPNATNMLLVAEDTSDGNTFSIQLPSSYGYFERSWAIRSYCFYVDDTCSPNKVYDATTAYGYLTASQLLPGTTHTITIQGTTYYNYGVLVIVYRVP